jgi:L-ribulose-5-phosphate 4-epimerase
MFLEELRSELAYYARSMYESRLVRATQGNISIRDQQSQCICVTPSSVDYQNLSAEDMVVVNTHGDIVDGKRKPTSEIALHTYILQKRSDIHCVMHTHSPYATAFGVVGLPIPVVLADSAIYLGGEIPIAPYQRSGTQAFAEHVATILGDGMAVLWGNHGAMVVGSTLALTFSAAHALEDNAQAYIIAKQLGQPALLSQQDIVDLRMYK